MLEIIAVFCLFSALIILYFLSAIDLKEGLLPNELVMGFLALGMIFHLCTLFMFVSVQGMLLGLLIGGGSLYIIRLFANSYYQQDALGLGDVKLMGAAGLWLGPHYIPFALALGACAGILHGLGLALFIKYKTGKMPQLGALSLPAGPGFAVGVILTGVIAFWRITALL